MAFEFPQIIAMAPISYLGVADSVIPSITFDFNVDVVTTQFSDPLQLAQNVQLISEEDGSSVPLTYSSYDSTNHRVILTPTVSLNWSTVYVVLVTEKILATTGRRSLTPFRWEFNTGTSGVGTPTLLAPPNYSVQVTFPTLCWCAVPGGTGEVLYNVLVDDSYSFDTPIYSVTTTATSVNPSLSFADESTYWWTVQAYTEQATGAWTQPQSFYYGTPRIAHESSRQSWNPADSFSISTPSFHLLTNMLAWPNIFLSFNSTPASGFDSYIAVIGRSVDPRNDKLTTYQIFTVNGGWTLVGNVATFNPTDAIQTNTRYTILVDQGMQNTDGLNLSESSAWFFTGQYTPYYCDIMTIKSRFLGITDQLPDDLINTLIYQASLQANSRYYSYLYAIQYTFGDMLKEPMVRDQPLLNSYGVSKWTEACSTYYLLKSLLHSRLGSVGTTRKLGDFEIVVGPDFLKAMEMAMNEAKSEMYEWDGFLMPSTPVATSRSTAWSPDFRLIDWSVRGDEAIHAGFRSGNGLNTDQMHTLTQQGRMVNASRTTLW